MSNGTVHHGTLVGTIGGTLLSVSASIHAGDVVKTIVLGMVGALTSFTCSYLLKLGFVWIRGKFR